jgi:23S rRNA maturation mini-RNase III
LAKSYKKKWRIYFEFCTRSFPSLFYHLAYYTDAVDGLIFDMTDVSELPKFAPCKNTHQCSIHQIDESYQRHIIKEIYNFLKIQTEQ